MTMNRFIPRRYAGPSAAASFPATQDRLEIIIDEAAASDGRMPGAPCAREPGEGSESPHALSMPWNDLLWLLTGDRLDALRRLRSDPARASATEQTASLEWAGLVSTDAEGRSSVPYREIVVRIPL